jgi:hypothetical protein
MLTSKKQAGGALIGYMMLATAGAGLAAYYGVNKMKSDYEVQVINESALKMEQVQSTQLQCYNDLRRWCTETELTGYYQGDNQIIGGDNIVFAADGRNLLFSVNTFDNARAKRLSELVVSPTVNGTIVRSSIRPPTDASIFSERLQRYDNAIDSNRVVMATDLNVASNDVNNAENVFAQIVNVETLNAETLNTNRTIVSSDLIIVDNRIASVGSNIEIYAATVKPSGTVSLDKNLIGSSTSNLNGFTNANGGEGTFENTTTNTLTVENGNVDTLNVDVANVVNLTASTGNISNSIVTNLTFDNAVGRRLDTTSISVNNTITGSELNSTDATIDTLNSTNAIIDSAVMSNINSTTTITNELIATNAQFLSLQALNTISDTASSGHVVASSANINSINTTTLSGNSGVATSTFSTELTALNADVTGVLTGDSLNTTAGVIGTANIINIDGTSASNVNLTNIISANIDADNLIGQSGIFANAYVNNSLISDALIADVANIVLVESITATITSADLNQVNATNGTVNTASANSFVAAYARFDDLNANGISANHVDIDTFNVDTINATGNSNVNTMNAFSFTGEQFYAVGDFYTEVSSVNGNAADLGALYGDIDNCINTTKYCVPSPPVVSLACPDCFRSAFRSEFGSVATATINNCNQGCSYSWITNGTGLGFSGCTPGTVAAGSSGFPSCSVNASVPNETTYTGSIQIVVSNSRFGDMQDSAGVGVSYENRTSNNPFINVNAGCFVDTIAFDTVQSGGCGGLVSTGGSSVYFNVGDTFGTNEFRFASSSDWSVIWSGDCAGSGNSCTTSAPYEADAYTISATAEVTHMSGQTSSYSVSASITPDSGE